MRRIFGIAVLASAAALIALGLLGAGRSLFGRYLPLPAVGGDAAEADSAARLGSPEEADCLAGMAQTGRGGRRGRIGPDRREELVEACLDRLAERFSAPAAGSCGVELEGYEGSLPAELLNRLAEAVCEGTSDALLEELHDESLEISAVDFLFEPNLSEEAAYSEQELNEILLGGGSGYSYFRIDMDGDGRDEILMIQRTGKYEYSHASRAFLLTPSGERYVFGGMNYISYYRIYAVFAYEGRFYLAVNYDDYKTELTKAVGLFALEEFEDRWWSLTNADHVFLRKNNGGCALQPIYINENTAVTAAAQEYLDGIKTDLVYTDRLHGTFWGDEENVDYDIQAKVEENVGGTGRLFETDADNDGRNELFCRRHPRNGREELKVVWYDTETYTACEEPPDFWEPEGHYLTQRWFKRLDGRTVAFSLYHENDGDAYLVEARLCEEGSSEPVLVYGVGLQLNVEADGYWDYDDANLVMVQYEDPDFDKALSDELYRKGSGFAEKTRGEFEARRFENTVIPESLLLLMERALFDRSVYTLDLGSASMEMDREAFYEKFLQMEETYDGLQQYVYRYVLDGEVSYLTVEDTGGSARFVDITMLKEVDGELYAVDSVLSLDIGARVIEYGGKPYLLEESYNYYSKYWDTVILHELTHDGFGQYLYIRLAPERFETKKLYDAGLPHGGEIDAYVEDIGKELMEASKIEGELGIFVGEENASFDRDRLQRLKSVAGEHDFYEVDFNNDGRPEYVTKHHWYPSNSTRLYLISNAYVFTEESTAELQNCFGSGEGLLIQLWFYRFGEKVYTFRLFLMEGYDYLLNVSLVEGSRVTQLQTWMIAPKCGFEIEEGPEKLFGRG